MCGIFGQSASNPNKLNQANIRILGMFNESRGKNSCGITYDDEIYHGLLTEKLFTDFMKGRNFKAEHNPLMFGHTRAASSGVVNEYNAHPFGFGVNKKTGGYKFIGVHNGTLYNQEELAEKYGVELTQTYTNQWKVETTRTKIDSEILLEIIHRSRSYDVLGDYIGRAALIWTDTTRPNVTYLWSGQSRMNEGFVTGALYEERPMNVWIENEESFYFSSLPDSLQAIGAESKDVFQIDYNTVYRVTNGNFAAAVKTPVSRLNCWHTETYVAPTTNYANRHNAMGYGNDCNWGDYRQGKLIGENEGKKGNHSILPANNTPSTAAKSTELNIYEDIPVFNQNDYGNKVYVKHLRYYKKGHLVTGIHIWIKEYGFYNMGETLKEAHDAWDKLKGVKFINGAFDISKLSTGGGTYPIPAFSATPSFLYIIDGILLKTQLDYLQTLRMPLIRQDYLKMSHMATLPIIDIKFAHKATFKQDIMKNGELYSGTINGLAYEKTYEVSKGNLVKVTVKPENGFPKVVKLPTIQECVAEHVAKKTNGEIIKANDEVLKAAYENIVKFEDAIIENEINLEELAEYQKSLEAIEDADEALEIKVTQLLDNEITPCLMSFQNVRDELDLLDESNEKVSTTKTLMKSLILLITNHIK